VQATPDTYENAGCVPVPLYRVYFRGIETHVFAKGNAYAALETYETDPEHRRLTCQLGDGPEWILLDSV